jgi:hypothetical protein
MVKKVLKKRKIRNNRSKKPVSNRSLVDKYYKIVIINIVIYFGGKYVNRKYSILKIIQNKTGYYSMILIFTGILALVFSFIFVNNMLLKIQVMCVSTIVIIVFSVWIIINIARINYFFKHGIEAKAFVHKENYVPSAKILYVAKTIVPWNSGDEKDGIKYRYRIGTEMYESTYRFRINGDTMFLKDGSVIDILVNPKNMNDTIIKDIFVK